MPITVEKTSPQFRIKGRSFMAFVLAPESPLPEWLAALDGHVSRAPRFFQGRAVVLDCAALTPGEPGWATLMADLQARDIRVVDVGGHAETLPGAEKFHAPFVGGRAVPVAATLPEQNEPQEPPAPPAPPPETSMIVREPVRSGQSIMFPEGDVTIVGSVASGAEVVAGGSIHVYGALRGRAIAGAVGNARAGIFCRKLEAELISIDGFYLVADAMQPGLRGRAVHARLDGDSIVMTALD
jgi:septum site-determining protein MinC